MTDEHGFLCHRILPSGKVLALVPLTFGRLRLCIGDFDFVEHGY